MALNSRHNRPYIADGHINTGASQHIQANSNLTSAIHINQFANKTRQRTFNHADAFRHGPKENCSCLSILQNNQA